MTTALHERALVVDAHNDSIIAHIRRGNLRLDGIQPNNWKERAGAAAYLRQYETPLGNQAVQLDLPKMKRGGLDTAFFAVDCTRLWGNHLLYCLDALGYFLSEIEAFKSEISIARRADDILQAKERGKHSAVLSVENSDALEKSLYVLPHLYKIGVRSMTLTHSTRSFAADGCEVEGGGGLTHFGIRLVEQMNELGMLVDISHINERGFWDTLERSQHPIIGTHNCCRALCDHPRNLHDEQLKALSEKGGVVGITFVPLFVADRHPTLDRLLDHIEHAIAVAGIDHVGLGSDFDGGGDLVRDATLLPQITAGLLARGYDEVALEKFLGLNWLRVFRHVVG
tara:strand:+ start:1034 stop:2053 length:1020 start_codon:yes stop_codon:yes gene_type:complete